MQIPDHKSAILAAILSLFSASAVTAQDSVMVLTGATIIDGLSESPLSGYSILIDGNNIVELLPEGESLPSGAKVVDLSGKYIMPGFIDTHVHWLDWMGELYVNNGVTSVVALTELGQAMRESSQASHGLPRLYHSANRPPFEKDQSAAEIRQVIREWLDKDPDIGHFPNHNEEISRAYTIAAKEVHRAGLMIFGHAENAVESIADGNDVVEHVWAFGQAAMSDAELQAFQRGDDLTWATYMSGDWDKLDQMIGDAVKNGIYLNPTLLYEWGGMSRDADNRELLDYRLLRNPSLVYFPENIAKSLLAKHRQIKNYSRRYGNLPYVADLPAEDRAEFEEGYQNVKEFIRRYVAAGGKIQAGTDAITGGVPGLGLHEELQVLVEAGLTPMQAIKSATRWSAELLEGINGKRGPAKVGSIEADKFADLVVLDEDPLRDIYNTMSISRVMKDGRWVTPGYHPEYYSSTQPPRSIAGSTFAPVLSSVTPAIVRAGHPTTRVILEGSGFQMSSLVKVSGISMKTYFINPRQVEFDMPARLLALPTPNPYAPPGPYQQTAIVGYRNIDISVFNPPPEGGLSNLINIMVQP